MKTLSKRFTVTSGQDVLADPEILRCIQIKFGDYYYNQLVKNHILNADFDIFFDTETQVQFRNISDYNKDTTVWEDLIGKKTYPYNEESVSQVIVNQDASGLIYLKRR